MNLKKVLTPEHMIVDLNASDKDEAIRTMVGTLAERFALSSVDQLVDAVLARERKDSTGLEQGIAVPHGKSDAVDSLVAGIARVPRGVDFGSRDGAPATILVMTISPLRRSGPHLQFIGEVVRLLRDAELRDRVNAAETARAMYEALVT
jgi:PTS system nitrogen regulatory IIA component